MTGWWAQTGASLADLVLPTDCPGCGVPGWSRPCPDCSAVLAGLRPAVTAPQPAPDGLPRCWAVGEHAGPLRGCLLAYKERGRYALAGPLGALLAGAVRTGAGTGPVLLVPVPATAAAARSRYGDHMARLARRAATALRGSGQPAAVARVLRARPREDSTVLDAAGRLRAARRSLAVRASGVSRVVPVAGRGVSVVLVDDVLTTGATLATAAALLRRYGVPVAAAAVLTATRRNGPRFR